MKRLGSSLCFLLVLLLCVSVSSCGSEEQVGTTAEEKAATTGVVGDLFWAWGNPEMAEEGSHTLATFAQASSAERARLLGAPNVVLAGFGLPDDDTEADRLTATAKGSKRFVWEVRPDGEGIGPPFIYDERLARIKRLVKEYPNLEGVLLDDMSTGKIDRGFKPEHIRHIKELLADAESPVAVWGVVYSMSFNREGINDYIQELDVINLWVWDAEDVVELEKYVAHCETLFPQKPIMLGLYLYDYAGERKIPQTLLETQCNTALKLAHAGRIQGIIFLTINNDPEVLKWTANWISEVRDQELRLPSVQATEVKKDHKTFEANPHGPAVIEGPDETLLRSYSQDGKVCVESSSDRGVDWKRISVIEDAEKELGSGYFTRLDDKTYLLTLREGNQWISWVRSCDGGATWSEPVHIISLANGRHGYSPICVMKDGRWAYCPYYEEMTGTIRQFQALLTWSHDQGQTWSEPVAFPWPEDGNRGLTECTVVQLGPNDFLAAIRSDEWPNSPHAFDGFYLSHSKDGLDWSTPVSLGERGRMPLFYRIGDIWALVYRLYHGGQRVQYSAVRFSSDGKKWSLPLILEKGVNAQPQLVQIQGELIAFNNRYPDRSVATRVVFEIPDWARKQAFEGGPIDFFE